MRVSWSYAGLRDLNRKAKDGSLPVVPRPTAFNSCEFDFESDFETIFGLSTVEGRVADHHLLDDCSP